MNLDGHVHTNKFKHHDQLRDYMVQKGLNGLVCTDHFKAGKHVFSDFRKGYDAMKTVCRDVPLTVLAGAEVSIDNDYLVYGLNIVQLEQALLVADNFFKMLEFVHLRGGIVIQAHPCRKKHGYYRCTVNQNVDGYEAVNGHRKHENRNYEIMDMMESSSCIYTAGSDAHGGADVGRAWMALPRNVADEADFVNCLKTEYHTNEELDILTS